MKLVASVITITTRQDFYLWLEKLPWTLTKEEAFVLVERAKLKKTCLWSYQTGFLFW